MIVLLAGLALFVGLYVSLLPPAGWLRRLGPGALGAALALLPVIAVAMLAGGAPTSSVAPFVYFVAAAGILLPPPRAVATVATTTADIAAALYLSEGTVRNYLSAAIGKLGARNRNEAIEMAADKGWL